MTDHVHSSKTVPVEQLRAAFAVRAAAYAHVFDVVRESYGEERAVEVLGEATRRMGAENGAKFADLAPDNLVGLKERLLHGMPAAAETFAPEVLQCDRERLVIKFHGCPLVETWRAMGRSDEDVALLCKAAAAVDRGLFAAAGFAFEAENWRPDVDGCLLKITPGAVGACSQADGGG